MDSSDSTIGPLEHLHVLEPVHSLLSVICSWFLSSETRSFGAWLEPRYIFGAGRLNRPVSYYAFFKGWLL